jgi:flagellar protein FliO/FliZ
MTQSIIWIVGVVALLALIPFGLKWVQRRVNGHSPGNSSACRVVSAIAVGPQQRVVVVEVGPAGNRICLVLGVTPQSVNCLYTTGLESASSDVSLMKAAATQVTV